jgi:cadmium resistance protein CadD (predicted permease)
VALANPVKFAAVSSSYAELLSLTAMSVGLYASTNLDDLFVLVGFFACSGVSHWRVVLGQMLGIVALVCVSAALAAAVLTVPREVVGLLGLAPMLLGVSALRKSRRGGGPEQETIGAARAGVGASAVALVTIANGSDNLAAYVPVFSAMPRYGYGVVALVFVLMTAGWCWLAQYLVGHARYGAFIRYYGQKIFPWLLVALGVHVLRVSGTVPWLLRFVPA